MFYDRLQAVCKEKGITVTKMLNDLSLSTGSTGNWKKGQLPKGDILAKIAKYLNVSLDYIVFGEYNTGLTSDEERLISVYRSIPEKAKYKLLCDFEKMVEEEIEKLAEQKGAV